MATRAEKEEFILKHLAAVLGISAAQMEKDENISLTKQRFARMSDKQFEEFLQDENLDLDGNKELAIVVPNNGKYSISIDRNIKICELLGYQFRQKLQLPEINGVPAHLSNEPYPLLLLPFGRQIQHVLDKQSIPDHSRQRDALSGQVTGDSKGGKISYFEALVLQGMGLEKTVIEFLKVRGGDRGSERSLNAQIDLYGEASLTDAVRSGTGVVSLATLKSLFLGMHYSINL